MGYRIWKLYELAAPRVREQFSRACGDRRQITGYLDVEQYVTRTSLSLEEQLRAGFDDLTLSDCIFHASMRSLLRDLQQKSAAQVLQRQLKYILEVQLCTGVPFVVEDDEAAATQFTEQNLKGTFDSYAIVTPGYYNVAKAELPVMRHDNSMPFQAKYKVFKHDAYVPIRLFIVYYDNQNSEDELDLCQVCLECKMKGVSREGYFTGNQTSQQLNFTPNKATLFCQNDNLRLCDECDKLLHRGILHRHTRTAIGHQCRLSVCPKHQEEKLAYEDASGNFLCSRCIQEQPSASANGIRNVADAYAAFLTERPGKININQELQLLYDQQTKLESVLTTIRLFNSAVEDALLEYFRGIIQQLAAHQNQLVQQLLGQLCALSASQAELHAQYSFINKQTQLTANEILGYFRRFEQNRQRLRDDLHIEAQNIQSFVNGLTAQIERFKTAYTAIPQEHLLNMQLMYGRYQHSRLYGIYSRSAGEVPVYIGQEGTQSDFGIEQQKLSDQLKDIHSVYDNMRAFKASTDKYSEQLAMNVFRVVRDNANIFTFNLQDQPIYDQLRASKKHNTRQEQIQQPQSGVGQVDGQPTSQFQEPEYHQDPLNEEQERQMSQSIFRNSSVLKQSGIDKQKYLDDIYGDTENNDQFVMHNAVQSQKDYIPAPQPSSVSQIFDMASRNVPVTVSQNPKVKKEQEQIINQAKSSSYIPGAEGQRVLQQSIAPQENHTDVSTEVNINLSTNNSAVPMPEFTQRVPEKSVLPTAGDHKTLQASYENLQRIYKMAERNQQISSQFFSEVIDSPQIRQMLYFQMIHTLKKERQYQKVKLIPVKRKFERRRGMKFAAIMEICKGAPCMMIMSLHFGSEKKQLALSICSELQSGIIQSKYQFLCDLDTQHLIESQDFTLGARQWSYGNSCIIAKDFAGVEYDGKYWTCDSIDVYGYDE